MPFNVICEQPFTYFQLQAVVYWKFWRFDFLKILGKAHNTPTQRTERCAKPDFKLTPEAMKAINARKAQLQTGFPKKAIPAPINTGAFWQDFVWYYYILKLFTFLKLTNCKFVTKKFLIIVQFKEEVDLCRLEKTNFKVCTYLIC